MTLTLYRNKGAQLTTAEADANMDHLGLSSNHTFTQSGSGASSRTAQAKLREIVSVTDFGTDATALATALAAVGNGGAVYIPPNTTIEPAADVDFSNKMIFGAGASSIIRPTSAVTNCLKANNSNNALTGFGYPAELRDLFIDGSNTTGKTGVLFAGTSESGNYRLKNSVVANFDGSGGKGVNIDDAVYTVIQDCEIVSNQKGLCIAGSGTNPTTTKVDNCYIRANLEEGCLIESAYQVTFRSTIFEHNRSEGLKVKPLTNQNALMISLRDCWFEANQFGQSSITTKYACVLDGTNSGSTMSARLSNVYFAITALTEKALDMNLVVDTTLDMIDNLNVSNSIRVQNANSTVTVISYPERYDWVATIENPDGASITYLPDVFKMTANWPASATWTAWTPTYTAEGSMTFGTVTTTVARYKKIGKTLHFEIAFHGTVGGTPAGYLAFSLPTGSCKTSNVRNAASVLDNFARETGTWITSGSTIEVRRAADATWTAAAGAGVDIHGTVELA